MGEMADEIIENIYLADDYTDGDTPTARCKYCGGHFYWDQRPDGSYYLMTEGGREHKCKTQGLQRIASADEFPDG